jgi:hypothetical protein
MLFCFVLFCFVLFCFVFKAEIFLPRGMSWGCLGLKLIHLKFSQLAYSDWGFMSLLHQLLCHSSFGKPGLWGSNCPGLANRFKKPVGEMNSTEGRRWILFSALTREEQKSCDLRPVFGKLIWSLMFYRDQLGVHIASQAGDLGQAVVWQVIIWEQVIQSLPPPPPPPDKEAAAVAAALLLGVALLLPFVSRCLSIRNVVRVTQTVASQSGQNVPSGTGQCVSQGSLGEQSIVQTMEKNFLYWLTRKVRVVQQLQQFTSLDSLRTQ